MQDPFESNLEAIVRANLDSFLAVAQADLDDLAKSLADFQQAAELESRWLYFIDSCEVTAARGRGQSEPANIQVNLDLERNDQPLAKRIAPLITRVVTNPNGSTCEYAGDALVRCYARGVTRDAFQHLDKGCHSSEADAAVLKSPRTDECIDSTTVLDEAILGR